MVDKILLFIQTVLATVFTCYIIALALVPNTITAESKEAVYSVGVIFGVIASFVWTNVLRLWTR